MLKLLATLTLIAALGALPAMAQSDAEVDAAIETNLGDPAAYHAAFDAIQQAVVDEHREAFAAWVAYPINVTADGEAMVIADEEQFVEHYDGVMTDEIRDAITGQQWQDLFVNYKGIMLGDGQVWLNGICKDDACASFEVKIIAIQSTVS
ncbi:MAG: hypothetical protein JWQ89_2614 [Devosia sp.]|uniref:hypothetical protein n=1 Tax=Devosia sp. TaxID=1871048 RepID=UPI002604EB40|nr:hypothetical protein [Devosia sp.]MDB5540887.1 hypothetical protein [Devosia sp.]